MQRNLGNFSYQGKHRQPQWVNRSTRPEIWGRSGLLWPTYLQSLGMGTAIFCASPSNSIVVHTPHHTFKALYTWLSIDQIIFQLVTGLLSRSTLNMRYKLSNWTADLNFKDHTLKSYSTIDISMGALSLPRRMIAPAHSAYAAGSFHSSIRGH